MKKTLKWLIPIIAVMLVIAVIAVVWYFSTQGSNDPEKGTGTETDSGDDTEKDGDTSSESESESESETDITDKHSFDEGIVTKEPTCYEEGILLRKCTECGLEIEVAIAKLEAAYTITIEGIGELLVSQNGKYKLEVPEKIGFEFVKWVDAEGNEFSGEGTIDKSLTVTPEFKLLDTKTIEELVERADGGAEVIRISCDIVIDRPIFVPSTTKIYSDNPVKLIRSAGYLGDLFVIGQNSRGENSILLNLTPALILGNEGYTGSEILLTIDGNRGGMNEGSEVVGTALFLVNSARVDMYQGVSVSNHQKLGNERTLLVSTQQFGTGKTLGGAAVMISSGSAFYMHGGVMDNNFGRVDALVLEDGSSSIPSGYGGAIYNTGTFRMMGGAITNCSANRGGAIYSNSIVEIVGGLLEGNYAENKGGAICTSGSASADTFIGIKDARIGTVIFRNNSAGTQGGAILSYFNSPLLLFGGVLFEGNSALGASGGAISTSGPITSFGNSFVGNTAKYYGGAIYQTYATEYMLRIIEFTDTTFEDNSANSGGAIYVDSEFYAKNCSFTANKAKNGGAITVTRVATLTSCTFTGNTASYRGGAVYVPYTEELQNKLKATIESSEFISNTAIEGGDSEERRGGAIYVGEYNQIKIKGSNFENNSATQYGGAINGARGVNIEISDSKISGSSATNGGAIWAYSGSTLNISGSELKNNTARKDGGAIYVYNIINASTTAFEGNTAISGGAIMVANGIVATKSCAFTANTANSGGAIFVSDGTYRDGIAKDSESGSTFTSNVAYRGGAIFASNAEEQTGSNKVTVNHTTFKANAANEGGSDEKRRGGAIYVAEYITITVNNSLFEENKATQYAGAISVARGSVLHINDSDFVKNSSDTNGGAIWAYSDSTINLSGNKFSENFTNSSGGAIYSYNIANISSSEFSKNSAANGGAVYVAGGETSVSGSVFDSNTAKTYGGAVYVSEATRFLDGKDTAKGSEFNKNSAAYGGAIYLANVDDPEKYPDREAGKATLEESAFVGNTATKTGGAIFTNSGAELSTTGAIFKENSATEGGAIRLSSSTYAYIDNGSRFEDNVATDGEGGAINSRISLELTATEFVNNKTTVSGTRGGAIYLTAGSLKADGATFEGNSAAGNGGAVVLTSAGISLFTSCKFTNNETTQRGGAIYVTSGELATVSCEFSGNKAVERGGAVYATTSGYYTDGDESISDSGSEFTANSSPCGGAIFADKSASLFGTAFENNSAVSAEEGTNSKGGAIASDYGTVTLTGTSFIGNTADLGGAIFDGKRLNLEIKSATVTENSSGIAIVGGSLSISGSVIIKDNTDYDVSLAEGKLITIVGALDENAEIGFATALESGAFAKADGVNLTDVSVYLDRFFNNDGYPVFVGDDGQLGCGLIIAEQPSVTNNYTVSTLWQPTSYTWYLWVDNARGEAVAGQNTATLTDGIDNASYVCLLAYGDLTVETAPVTVLPKVALQKHPICGSVCNCTDTAHNTIDWYPIADLAGLISAAATEGNYYLTEDIVIDATVTFTANVNLCLNGKKLSRSGEEAFAMLTVAADATLTITDCSDDVRVGYIDPETGLWTEGTYSGEGTAIAYTLYGGLITNGSGVGGSAISVNGTLNTYGINFAGNTASSGSAVYVRGYYNDAGSTFVGNAVSYRGGAIYVAYDENVKNVLRLTVKDATFISNSATTGGTDTKRRGGAIYIAEDIVASVDNSIFEGNSSTQYGGAINVANRSQLTLTNSTFNKNSSGTNGGAIWLYNGTSISVSGGEFKENSTGSNGGAIYSYNTVSLENVKFTSNTATNGGALYALGASTVTGCTFTENSASTNGGALYTSGTATVTSCTFTENSAGTNGGALLNIGGNATLTSCIFDSNTAGSKGGAIMSTSAENEVDGTTYYIPSTLTMIGGEVKNGIVDTTWTSSGSYGGGLMVNLGSHATLDGVTFDNNKAYSGGAITSYGSAGVLNSDGVSQTVYTNVTLNNVTLTNNDGQNGAVYVGGKGQMTANGIVATNNTSSGTAAVFYLTSAGSLLTVNSATISGNTGKGSIGFIQTANSENTLNIYKAGITGADVNDNWDVLIKKGNASTVNELTAPTTEQ